MKELIYSFPILLLVLLFACGENTQQNNVNYKIYHKTEKPWGWRDGSMV